MKMSDLQFAALSISLSTLGQVDLSDNDPELLRTLAYLLEAASKNVAHALAAQTPADMARRFQAMFGELGAGPGKETSE